MASCAEENTHRIKANKHVISLLVKIFDEVGILEEETELLLTCNIIDNWR